jgi:hypothetical protein
MHCLAQFDFVRPRWRPEDPRIAEFYQSTAYVNGLAEAHPGFIWREKKEDAAAAEKLWGEGVLYTLSVWRDVESLRHFLYRTPHIKYLKRGPEWFLPIVEPRTVLWWIDVDHRPTLDEASARLGHLRAHGPSHKAFDLTHSFDPPLASIMVMPPFF